jgi:hypothetical protein
MNTDTLIARLNDGATASLVTLSVDHVMTQPVNALIEADWLAGQIVTAIAAASESDQTERWIRERIAELRANPPPGSLRDQLPTEVIGPVRDMVVRPFVPDRVIIGRMLGHRAVETLVRDLLVGAIQSFSQRFRPNLPSGIPGAGLGLRSLKKVRKSVLGGIGQELEKQAESRVREFVDSVLAQVLAQVADRICDAKDAEIYGRFRGHLMDQILDTPMVDLDHELGKVDPDALVQTGVAIANSLAKRANLRDEVRDMVQAGLEAMGDKTIGAHLKEAGITDEWRAEIEPQMVNRCAEIVQTTAFHDWLTDVLETR